MSKRAKNKTMDIDGTEVRFQDRDGDTWVCLTDIAARFGRSGGIISNWLRNRSTIEFLGLWEKFNNKSFNVLEFENIRI